MHGASWTKLDLGAGGGEVRAILRDGRVAEVREAQGGPDEERMLRSLFLEASQDAMYSRFMHAVREPGAAGTKVMLESGRSGQYTLLCIAGERILGISHYIPVQNDAAEIDFFVDERSQGNGIGRLLLEEMAEVAWRAGLRRFEAYTLRENLAMIAVLRNSGYEVIDRTGLDASSICLELPLGATERSRAHQEAREKLSTAASLGPFFNPRSVAVVGASRDPRRLGHLLFRHVLESGFTGTAYPVNPSAHAIAAVRAYARVSDVPERIDLALLAVPAREILQTVEDCIGAGVRAVAILSAGFSDRGETDLEREVTARLRGAGVRLLGPNCLGLLTTQSDAPLNASFAPVLPLRGHLAIASQSGALGIAVLDYASRIGVGVSSFASLGNKADVSGNDVLQYWEDDPDTQMIALYLESFGNPRKFSRIARRIAPRKPILVVKSARTPAGAAVSEARPAAAGGDQSFEALFRQSGIIRADTLEELFDAAALLDAQPLPMGQRVAVLTNSAGGAVITVDALLREGLELARPPVDLGFEALAEGYRHALPGLLRDPSVDAVIVLFMPIGISDTAGVAEAISAAVAESGSGETATGKPILANVLSTSEGAPPIAWIAAGTGRIPVYPFPERAVRALGKVTSYAVHRDRLRGHVPDLQGVHAAAARAQVRSALAGGVTVMEGDAARPVLSEMGMKVETEIRGGTPFAIEVWDAPLFGAVLRMSRPGPEYREDPVLRITPLTDRDAREMASLGWPKAAEPDLRGLTELLLRVSRLVEELPEVAAVRMSVAVDSGEAHVLTAVIEVASAG